MDIQPSRDCEIGAGSSGKGDLANGAYGIIDQDSGPSSGSVAEQKLRRRHAGPVQDYPGDATTMPALLRTFRGEAKLTLAQVAKALGVSNPSVWAWENGKAKPAPERLEAIAKVYQVPAHVLSLALEIDRDGTAAAARAQEDLGFRRTLLDVARQFVAMAYDIEPKAVRIAVEL